MLKYFSNCFVVGYKKPLERWEFCTNMMQKHMKLAVDVLSENKSPISNSTLTVVNNVFNTILKTLKKTINRDKFSSSLLHHLNQSVSMVYNV